MFLYLFYLFRYYHLRSIDAGCKHKRCLPKNVYRMIAYFFLLALLRFIESKNQIKSNQNLLNDPRFHKLSKPAIVLTYLNFFMSKVTDRLKF